MFYYPPDILLGLVRWWEVVALYVGGRGNVKEAALIFVFHFPHSASYPNNKTTSLLLVLLQTITQRHDIIHFHLYHYAKLSFYDWAACCDWQDDDDDKGKGGQAAQRCQKRMKDEKTQWKWCGFRNTISTLSLKLLWRGTFINLLLAWMTLWLTRRWAPDRDNRCELVKLSRIMLILDRKEEQWMRWLSIKSLLNRFSCFFFVFGFSCGKCALILLPAYS